MNTLKKLAVGLALFLYMPLLLALTGVVSFNQTVARSDVIKQSLRQSGVYEALARYITDQASKNNDVSESPLIASSLKKVTSADELQKITEPAVNSVYTWLNDPKKSLKISVSVAPIKKNFTNEVLASLKKQLATLPTCTVAKPLKSTDPFQANCLPPGTSKQDVLDEARSQLQQQNILPSDNNLSLDSSKPEKDSSLATPIQDNNLKLLGAMYRIARASLPYLAGLTILSTVAVIFLSDPRSKGFKRLGKLLVVTGLVLVVCSGILLLFMNKFAGVRPGVIATVATTFEEAGKIVIGQMLHISLWFGVGYTLVGVTAVTTGVILAKKNGEKEGHSDAAEHVEQEDLLPPDEEKITPDNNPSQPAPEVPKDKPAETKEPSPTKINIKNQ